jgi:uncharacterized protein (DUF1778 family)
MRSAGAKQRTSRARTGRAAKNTSLLMRLDRDAKALVQKAARLQHLTVSDYVRSRILPLAQQELDEASTGVLRLSKADQTALWQALQHPAPPTPAQKALGKLIQSVL